MNRPTVLILSTDASFARELTSKWTQASANSPLPDFVVLDPSLGRDLSAAHYELAIADAGNLNSPEADASHHLQRLEEILAASGKPAILVHSQPDLGFCSIKSALTLLHREPSIWPDITCVLGREILRRCRAEARGQQAESLSHSAHADATLGRYMLEMRVSVNNALTTLLGNAELLSHESGLPANIQMQAEAIRTMALRLHGIFQRFSLLDKELNAGARTEGPKALAATTIN